MKSSLVACLVLCACGTPYPTTWQRDGSSAEDLRRDTAQCRVQAMTGSAPIADGIAGYEAAKSIYRDCMIGKGWTSTSP